MDFYECYMNDFEQVNYSYNEIIKNTAELFNELNITNLIEQYFTLCLLLWKYGFFSVNNKFETKDQSYPHISSFKDGMYIMNGDAVCRHIADFFNSMLSNMGYKPRALYIHIVCDEKDDYNKPNHLALFMKYENHYLIFDPTFGTISEIFKDLNIYYYFKQPLFLFTDNIFTGDIKLNRKKIQKIRSEVEIIDKPLYTREQVLQYLANAKNICKINSEQINYFNTANTPHTQSVSKLVLKYKNYYN